MNSPLEFVNHDDISSFVETHQSVRDAVERAKQQFAGKSDAAEALRKLLPALSEKVVKVFFSYKKTDERAAQVIIDVLREGSADKLDISHMGDFSQIAGTDWRKKIRERVRAANWFILLLPNPSDELDWCLYETGLFEAQLTAADRLICLHHPDTAIPSPIDVYQAVAATKPDMEKFLRMALVEENPVAGMLPISRSAERRIPELASRIVDAIRAPRKKVFRRVFLPAIELCLDGVVAFKTVNELDTAAIVGANDEGLKIFGYEQFEGKFGDLRAGIAEENSDSRWREELFHVVRKIAKKRTFHPIQAVMYSPDGKIYRPVAHAADRAGETGQVLSCTLTFAEDVTASDNAHMPAELANLATLLRFAFRFRWEVLERFSKGPLTDEDIAQLDINLTRIVVDWESRGAKFEERVPDLFHGKEADRVRAMTCEWQKLHNPESTGELDEAISQKNGRRVTELLAGILTMNQEFLEMAAERFSEMIAGSKLRSQV